MHQSTIATADAGTSATATDDVTVLPAGDASEDEDDKENIVLVKSKAVQTRRIPHRNKATSTDPPRRPARMSQGTQTGGPKFPFLLPVPTPAYVPMPMQMYSAHVPHPVPVPLPVPVPVFVPTTRNSYRGIRKQIRRIVRRAPREMLEEELLRLADQMEGKAPAAEGWLK